MVPLRSKRRRSDFASRAQCPLASDTLLDAGAGFVEGAGEEGWLLLLVGLVGDDGAMPRALAASRLAGVAFVADDGVGLNIGPDIEQNVEITRVGGFAAGQVEGDGIAGGVRFCLDFRGEAAPRAPERLAFLPPLLQPPTSERARRWSRKSEGYAPWSSSTRACRRRPRRRRPCSGGRSASTGCSKDRSAPAAPASERSRR
jgi:hypothetical protein